MMYNYNLQCHFIINRFIFMYSILLISIFYIQNLTINKIYFFKSSKKAFIVVFQLRPILLV